MSREEFLIVIWKKVLKPTFLALVIFFCIRFLYLVFTESGKERLFTLIVVGIGALFTTARLIRQAINSVWTSIYSRLPESMTLRLKIAGRILNYVATITFGIVIYHFWREDWKAAAFTLGIVLIQRVFDIVKEEKTDSALATKS